MMDNSVARKTVQIGLTYALIAYVRRMLEYNSVTQSPHLKCDIEQIEKVQRQFTK